MLDRAMLGLYVLVGLHQLLKLLALVATTVQQDKVPLPALLVPS